MVNGIDVKHYNKRDCVLFNSYCRNKNVVLSNLYDKCRIDYCGLVFHSSEQLFFWLLLDGNEKARSKIMQCDTAKDCKKKAKYYLERNGWNKNSEECQRAEVQALRVAIGEKMRCCKEFRELVMTSSNKKIVEYAWWGDDKYGCVDADVKNMYSWYSGILIGQNICGRLIMEWRKKYLSDSIKN